jgi:hypothetical protein
MTLKKGRLVGTSVEIDEPGPEEGLVTATTNESESEELLLNTVP